MSKCDVLKLSDVCFILTNKMNSTIFATVISEFYHTPATFFNEYPIFVICIKFGNKIETKTVLDILLCTLYFVISPVELRKTGK